MNVANRFVKAEVELWDTSGDLKYQKCWPALARDAQGVIFVFNPEDGQSASQLDQFHSGFANGNDNNCIVFASIKSSESSQRYSAQLCKFQRTTILLPVDLCTDIDLTANRFSRIPQLEVDIEEEGNRLRSDFSTFLSNLATGLSARRDQEEMHIINR